MLLYVDDTVVFGTDEKEFQNDLDMFYEYSELWHLSINLDKTKIMVFSLNIFYSINTNDIQHTYSVDIQRIRKKA